MTQHTRSVAMTDQLDARAQAHLLRDDHQEDLCFALWNPSRGRVRFTALLERLILPLPGERGVHGNASFTAAYFERALAEACAAGAGLALLHSHPFGHGWQNMSLPDVAAEQGHAGATLGATGLPLVGLTLAGDGAWSGRFWERAAPRTYLATWCTNVRVVGERLAVTWMDKLAPPPRITSSQVRTVSAWGERPQGSMARLRVGIIGAGSVGGFIAESMARSGHESLLILDFDRVEIHNLDRLIYATLGDVGALKAQLLSQRLKDYATAERFRADPLDAAVYEEAGFLEALDCDVLFCCVDRPWGRHVLNFIAYAHLIPVIDGGIHVRRSRSGLLAAADWRAHTATVGRACLQCLKQYDLGMVQVERDGHLDDPTYIDRLPEDHALRVRENVFAFSMSCAGLMNLQMLALVLAPQGLSNPGAQRYHFVGNFMAEPKHEVCAERCVFREIIARGDSAGITVTGVRPTRLVERSEMVWNEENDGEQRTTPR